jgi:hypothetical protein
VSGTLTERRFSFESGTGANKYTFVIFVNADDDMFVTDITTPNGTFNFDSGMLPESVARDIDAALDTVQAML